MTMICVSQIVHQRILYLRIFFFSLFNNARIRCEYNIGLGYGATLAKLTEGSGRANILLLGGTKIHIDDALYSTKCQRNLLSFKDIRRNGYHIETANKDSTEYIYITDVVLGKKNILEKLLVFSSGLDQQIIMSSLLYNWFLVENQIFPI